jgi:hypothetical protein
MSATPLYQANLSSSRRSSKLATASGSIPEFFEDDRRHTFELALLIRREMIEIGFH